MAKWQSHVPITWSQSFVFWLKYSHRGNWGLQSSRVQGGKQQFCEEGIGYNWEMRHFHFYPFIAGLTHSAWLWSLRTRTSGLRFAAHTVSCQADPCSVGTLSHSSCSNWVLSRPYHLPTSPATSGCWGMWQEQLIPWAWFYFHIFFAVKWVPWWELILQEIPWW